MRAREIEKQESIEKKPSKLVELKTPPATFSKNSPV